MSLREKLNNYNKLVAFSHTIFALPFAVAAVLMALSRPHQELTITRMVIMLVCMVSARTAAMAWNRYIDRDVDAQNPRTRQREIPANAVSPGAALGLALGSSALFVIGASLLGKTTGILSLPVLGVLLGYSLTKRFTWGAHLFLGLALALAPGGAWLAVGASPEAGIIALMLAVLTWVSGFDILYSLQDEEFDRENGLFSIPSRFGTIPALIISGTLHVGTILCLLGCGHWLGCGVWYFLAVGLIAALLVYEHALVGKGDLSKINKAFFDINGYISMSFAVLTAVDVWQRHAW
jgi:4-hydroxybenzoate polyprenyltransferase